MLKSIVFTTILFNLILIPVLCDPDGPDPWYGCDSDKYADRCFGSDCTDKDINYRIGVECDEFPWYAGGEHVIEREKEKVECIEGYSIVNSNLTSLSFNGYGYCSFWKTKENSKDPTKNRTQSGSFETEIGRCTCVEETEFFCSYWECETEENNVACGYSSSSDTSLECTDKIHTELKDCTCHNISSTPKQIFLNGTLTNFTYCAEWECKEYKRKGGIKEIETNRCKSLVPTDAYIKRADLDVREDTLEIEALSNQFCWVWETDINSYEEIELITCKCLDVSEEKTYCSSWRCREKDYAKHFRSDDHLLWPILGPILYLIFGGIFYGMVAGAFGFFFKNEGIRATYWLVALLVYLGFFLWLVAATGGVAFIIIWGCIAVPIGCIIWCIAVVSNHDSYSRW